MFPLGVKLPFELVLIGLINPLFDLVLPGLVSLSVAVLRQMRLAFCRGGLLGNGGGGRFVRGGGRSSTAASYVGGGSDGILLTSLMRNAAMRASIEVMATRYQFQR